MTIYELTRSFLEIGCKPKKNYKLTIFFKVPKTDNPEECLHNNYIGDWQHFRPSLKEAEVCKWAIYHDSIVVVAKTQR